MSEINHEDDLRGMLPGVRTCVGCGKEFEPCRTRRNTQRYCTIRCATARGPWAFPVNKAKKSSPAPQPPERLDYASSGIA